MNTHLDLLEKGLTYSKHEANGGRIKFLSVYVSETTVCNLHTCHTVDVEHLELTIISPCSNSCPFSQSIATCFPNLLFIEIYTNTTEILGIIRQLPQLRCLTAIKITLVEIFNPLIVSYNFLMKWKTY